METQCPYCNFQFEAEMWYDGNCDKCQASYHFEEYCTEDYSDCWASISWEK